MQLFSKQTYINRRAKLAENMKSGKLLFLGNIESPMNYKDNTFRFRQDSTFLYYFGINLPGIAVIYDIDNQCTTLYGNEYSMDDIIWIGEVEAINSLAEKVGINFVKPFNEIYKNVGPETQYLPPYRHENKILLAELLDLKIKDIGQSLSFTKAVIAQRSIKEEQELLIMDAAVNISQQMHMAALRNIKEGKKEYEITAKVLESLANNNAELSYPIICSVNGQTLHNHYHGFTLGKAQLLLLDTGAEHPMGYAGDITRTFPVSKKFNSQQAAIYETVLKMEVNTIENLKAGSSYYDAHINANKILIINLKEIGILKGDIEQMLYAGVGGLFMPHGLGHMIGLDVHDMEDLGENLVGYETGQIRSTQLGLKSLRLARNLEAGMALTVEPGCYFIPQLIEKYKAEGKFLDYVNYAELEKYKTFGGIRIEDNLAITETGIRLIGDPIIKTISEIENFG